MPRVGELEFNTVVAGDGAGTSRARDHHAVDRCDQWFRLAAHLVQASSPLAQAAQAAQFAFGILNLGARHHLAQAAQPGEPAFEDTRLLVDLASLLADGRRLTERSATRN